MRLPLTGLLLASMLAFAGAPRDPFARPEAPDKPLPTCTSSLCRYALSDLKLVAIISPGPESAVMFEDRFGNGYVARRNAQIGSAGARMTLIERECVTLTHFTTAADGRSQQITERMCIPGAGQPIAHDYLRDGPWIP